eukprot:COSAG05_NODE_1368_length_5060_cov_5.437412_3_plen_331_part_00
MLQLFLNYVAIWIHRSRYINPAMLADHPTEHVTEDVQAAWERQEAAHGAGVSWSYPLDPAKKWTSKRIRGPRQKPIKLPPPPPPPVSAAAARIVEAVRGGGGRSVTTVTRQSTAEGGGGPETESCSVELRVLVLTMDRSRSLQRLLRSLNATAYDGACVAVDVWLDVSPPVSAAAENGDAAGHRPTPNSSSSSATGEDSSIVLPDLDTVEVAAAFSADWPHRGPFSIHIHPANVGLAWQWHNTWNASLSTAQQQQQQAGGGLQADATEIGLILEDDLEVSPEYWRFLKSAHAAYAADETVAGVSLARANMCMRQCADLKGGPVDDGAVFK